MSMLHTAIVMISIDIDSIRFSAALRLHNVAADWLAVLAARDLMEYLW